MAKKSTKKTAPATIGDNNPPETPFEISQAEIQDLYNEAQVWLDGEGITTEEMAEKISMLLQMLRSAGKTAEERRTDEKSPHLLAGKAVDKKYGELKKKVTMASDACKEILQPWLQMKAAEKEAEDQRLREEADRKKREADRAMQTSTGNLAEREEAEKIVEEAKTADIEARVQKNKSAGQQNKGGRAVSLRTVWNTHLTDPDLALNHYWPDERIEELLLTLAKADVRGGKRTIPGFHIEDEKVTN